MYRVMVNIYFKCQDGYDYMCQEYSGIEYNTKEEAGKTKAQIARRYEKDRLREEQLESSIKAFAQVVLRTAKANEDYRKERTLDNADKLCESIDGVMVQSNIAETKGLADEV